MERVGYGLVWSVISASHMREIVPSPFSLFQQLPMSIRVTVAMVGGDKGEGDADQITL